MTDDDFAKRLAEALRGEGPVARALDAERKLLGDISETCFRRAWKSGLYEKHYPCTQASCSCPCHEGEGP